MHAACMSQLMKPMYAPVTRAVLPASETDMALETDEQG